MSIWFIFLLPLTGASVHQRQQVTLNGTNQHLTKLKRLCWCRN